MDLENRIKRWKRKLYQQQHFEEGTIEELESHIRDAIDTMKKQGQSEEEAFNNAIDKLGPIALIDQQENLVNTHNASNWTLALLNNFIKISRRHFVKYKSYHFINISGLSIAFTGLIFIGIYLFDELTYEQMHPDHEKIYRLSYTLTGEDGKSEKQAYSSGSWAALLADEIPAIEDYFRFIKISYGYVSDPVKNEHVYTEEIYWSDSNALDFLNLPMKWGRKEDQLKDLSSLVLTETTAARYFGEENPIGKRLDFVRRERTIPLTVTGVIYDPPSNTHFQPQYLASIHALEYIYGEQNKGWITQRIRPGWCFSYIKLKDADAISMISNRLKEIWDTRIPVRSENMTPLITALTDIHFNPPIKWEIDSPIDVSYLYGLVIIGAFILIIVMTNYLNLTVAQASKRHKEIGIRQTLGSTKSQLRFQFILESFITIIGSMMVAVALVYVLMNPFNELIDKNINFQSIFLQTPFPIYILEGTIVIAFLAGLYPAFYFTKNTGSSRLIGINGVESKSSNLVRSFLVVIQFAVAVTMIISTLTVYNQLKLINSSKLGANREAIIGIRTTNMGTRAQIQRFRNEIITHQEAVHSTLGMHLPRQSDFGRIDTRFKIPALNNETRYWNKFDADGGFAKTFDLEFIAGGDFRENVDSTQFIINESAVTSLGITPHEAIGLKIIEDSINYVFGNSSGTVIGVVKDFAYETIRSKINPVVISANVWVQGALSVKLGLGDKPQIIHRLADRWRNIFPGRPFEYWFLDNEFERLYKQERRLGRLIPIFSGLAIFIALLGLFALVSYIVELRKKEIGIRKVLGASIVQITQLITSNFMKLVLIALGIGIPVAWIGMNQWLEGFTYRVSMNIFLVGLAAMTIILLALLTIGIKSITAANSNPVECLKNE